MRFTVLFRSLFMSVLIWLLLGGICNAADVEQMQTYDKNVLIIQSYNRDYIHSREIETGIEEEFQKSSEKIRLYYEFMDTKNYINEEYFRLLADEYKLKYLNQSFDAIILCDDDALNFYDRYGKSIWPDTVNIVATGINSISNYKDGLDGVHIVEERFEYKKNIDLAIAQNSDKKIKRLNFIYDVSTTGEKIRKDIEKLTSEEYSEYEIHNYYNKTPEELKKILTQSDEHDLFFFTIYFKSTDGRVFNYNEVPEYLFSNIKFPVYGFAKFYLNTGIVGGYMISSETYGKKAANIVLSIWKGETVPAIILEDGSNATLMFDYNMLKKVNLKNIPDGAVLVNHPLNYFAKNKELVAAFSIVIFILTILVIFLSFVIFSKNREQHQTNEINRLNLNLIGVQKDIVLRLGEVIETRSHETANHVERVAKISGILAKGCGLKEQDVDLLVMISPMHDIGKIGVPEEILNKPGKLTTEEFEIMKTHTQIGHRILKNSDNEILLHASILSLEHHERFDGMGYPSGLKGKEINIFSRITTLADVYDALRSERVYKKAWPLKEAEEYIVEQKGRAFDPEIVDVFIEYIDEIRDAFNDLGN